MELKDLQKIVAQFRDERDWKQFHNPKDLAMAISKPQQKDYKIL